MDRQRDKSIERQVELCMYEEDAGGQLSRSECPTVRRSEAVDAIDRKTPACLQSSDLPIFNLPVYLPRERERDAETDSFTPDSPSTCMNIPSCVAILPILQEKEEERN